MSRRYKALPLITICVCTFKRPEQLGNLLCRLKALNSENSFQYSIIVVDNDREMSGERAFRGAAINSKIIMEYKFEPRQNIALARNSGVRNAKGCFIAFIDDDELPSENWLSMLYKTIKETKADGCLGPVIPKYIRTPPTWITKGKYFERPRYATGTILHWSECRTGNVLIRKRVFEGINGPFDESFGAQGEDVDFFRKATHLGYKFVWCDEAPVYELVPEERCKEEYIIRKAILQGSASAMYSGDFRKWDLRKIAAIGKAVAALLLYLSLIPFLFLWNRETVRKLLFKSLHHGSRLSVLIGIRKVDGSRSL